MTDAQRRKLLAKAERYLKATKKGYDPTGPNWRQAMALLNELDDDLKPDVPPTPAVPLLGPLQAGGQSLLRLSLTHQTDGLPLYPALDAAWAGGRVLAPEAGRVTRHSGGPTGGYSVYITGASGLRYYYTHLYSEGRAPVGNIAKGAKVGTVGSPKVFPGQRITHAHVGVNIEQWDTGNGGKQLKYGRTGRGPDYTTGSPSIGAQLKEMT